MSVPVRRLPPRRRASASARASRGGCRSPQRATAPRRGSLRHRDGGRGASRMQPLTSSVRPRSSGQSSRLCSTRARSASSSAVSLAPRAEAINAREQGRGRSPPRTVEPMGVRLELVCELGCAIELADLDQRLGSHPGVRGEHGNRQARSRGASRGAARGLLGPPRDCRARARGDRGPRADARARSSTRSSGSGRRPSAGCDGPPRPGQAASPRARSGTTPRCARPGVAGRGERTRPRGSLLARGFRL